MGIILCRLGGRVLQCHREHLIRHRQRRNQGNLVVPSLFNMWPQIWFLWLKGDYVMKRMNMGNKSDEPRSFSTCDDGRVVKQWMDIGGTFSPLQKTMSEPLQGCARDCFFIAALKAVALKANGTLMKTSAKFTFLNTKTMTVEDQYLNDVKIAIQNTTNEQVYARCSSAYRWPMLYEKAYALWIDSQNAQRHWDPIDPTQPDIKTIFQDGGNGVTAIMHITRYRTMVEKQNLLVAFDGNTPRYPMVAATKGIDPANLKLPDQLTAKHTYTITRKDANYFYLVDPCTNLEKRLAIGNLTLGYFDTWGYATP
jgi:hypothetical protein